MGSLVFLVFVVSFFWSLCPVNVAEFVIDNGILTTEDLLKSNGLGG